MNFNTNDNPVLIAPRPVRLTSAPLSFVASRPMRLVSAPAPDTIERVSPLDDLRVGLFDSPPLSDKDQASPRSSPRSALSSEALEEFLSILKPSFFPPRSPILRTRPLGASLPNLAHEVACSYKNGRIELAVNGDIEEQETSRSASSSRNGVHGESADGNDTAEDRLEPENLHTFRWFTSNVLSSPISRNHTRNPFQRHASYPISHSPVLNLPPLPSSPATIPLPPPTPNEMIEMS